MALCYVWTLIGNLNIEQVKDVLNYFGFKVDTGMQENKNRLQLNIKKLNDTEPSATEKTTIQTKAEALSVLLEWV